MLTDLDKLVSVVGQRKAALDAFSTEKTSLCKKSEADKQRAGGEHDATGLINLKLRMDFFISDIESTMIFLANYRSELFYGSSTSLGKIDLRVNMAKVDDFGKCLDEKIGYHRILPEKTTTLQIFMSRKFIDSVDLVLSNIEEITKKQWQQAVAMADSI